MAAKPKGGYEADKVGVALSPTSIGSGTSARVVPLKVEAMPTQLEIPAEIADKAARYIERYEQHLKARTEALLEAAPEAGEPTLAGGYQYWNCLTAGPLQFFGNPPYRPGKIIAAGELALMLGVVWINPLNGPGGSLPGTIVLGARNYRVRFDGMNVSNVTDGPNATFTGVFTSPAPVVSVFPFFFIPGDPGVNPRLFEMSLTCDIVETGQPMAAFSTWHVDPDSEPPFFGLPGVPPGLQYDIPARYLVYRK